MGDEIASWFSENLEQPVRLLYIGENGWRDGPAPGLVPRRAKPKPSSGFMSWISRTTEEGEELHAQKIQFADAAPLLITTVRSERDALSRMVKGDDSATAAQEEDVILRFRSNIHIDNTAIEDRDGLDIGGKEDDSTSALSAPYAKERWKTLSITTTTSSRAPSHENTPPSPLRIDLVFNTVRCQSLNVDFATGEYLPADRQLYRLMATKDRRVNGAFPLRPCFGRYGFAEPFGRTVRVGDVVSVEGWIGK